MPLTDELDIDDLYNETRRIQVEHKGRSFYVDYAPECYDTYTMVQIKKLQDEVAAQGVFPDMTRAVRIILGLIRGWGLRSQGKPLPIDEDTVSRLPNGMMFSIYSAILSDATVSEKKDEPSSSTSPPMDNPAPSPNGTGSSGRPAIWLPSRGS